MLIYFVRHGHPNYRLDCLTELGRKHAAAAAERLRDAGIEKIYASTHGRATETAEYTAKLLGLEVVPCEFMREISWKSLSDEPILLGGHPWNIADAMAAEGVTLTDTNWKQKEPFCKSHLAGRVTLVEEGIDAFLADLGYTREGEYYRVTKEDEHKTIAIFSHAGSSSAAIAHLMNIPFMQFCGYLHPDFTSISVISLPNRIGEKVIPRAVLLCDSRHIEGITEEG